MKRASERHDADSGRPFKTEEPEIEDDFLGLKKSCR